MSRGRALGPGCLRKDGNRWVLDWTDEAGRRRRKMLGTNRATAERLRSEIIHRRDLARAGLGAEAGLDLTLADLLRDYLDDLRSRVSLRHLLNVESRLAAVVEELGSDRRVRDLRPMDAVRVRNDARAAGLSARTANLRIDRLRALLRWAERNGLIAQNPLRHVERLPDGEGNRRYQRRALSEDEIRRFLAASEADDADCEVIWDYARVPQTVMWITLLATGIRYGEMRQLRWGDVDLARRLLVVRAETAKARRQRVIPIRAELVDRLRALSVAHEAALGRIPTVSDNVFLSPEGRPWPRPSTNPNRILRRLLERASIARVDQQGQKLDIHALRHTAASRMARAGVPLVHAQRVLGHSTPVLTAQVYSHLDAEDLRGSVEALPAIGTEAAIKEARHG